MGNDGGDHVYGTQNMEETLFAGYVLQAFKKKCLLWRSGVISNVLLQYF